MDSKHNLTFCGTVIVTVDRRGRTKDSGGIVSIGHWHGEYYAIYSHTYGNPRAGRLGLQQTVWLAQDVALSLSRVLGMAIVERTPGGEDE